MPEKWTLSKHDNPFLFFAHRKQVASGLSSAGSGHDAGISWSAVVGDGVQTARRQDAPCLATGNTVKPRSTNYISFGSAEARSMAAPKKAQSFHPEPFPISFSIQIGHCTMEVASKTLPIAVSVTTVFLISVLSLVMVPLVSFQPIDEPMRPSRIDVLTDDLSPCVNAESLCIARALDLKNAIFAVSVSKKAACVHCRADGVRLILTNDTHDIASSVHVPSQGEAVAFNCEREPDPSSICDITDAGRKIESDNLAARRDAIVHGVWIAAGRISWTMRSCQNGESPVTPKPTMHGRHRQVGFVKTAHDVALR